MSEMTRHEAILAYSQFSHGAYHLSETAREELYGPVIDGLVALGVLKLSEEPECNTALDKLLAVIQSRLGSSQFNHAAMLRDIKDADLVVSFERTARASSAQ